MNAQRPPLPPFTPETAVEIRDAYLMAAGIADDGRGLLFRSAIGKTGALAGSPQCAALMPIA
jgi:hypothetical protein